MGKRIKDDEHYGTRLMRHEQIIDFLAPDEHSWLLRTYEERSDSRVVKKTGPKILELRQGQDIIFDGIVERLQAEFGDFELRHAHIFDVTERPHILHNDNDSDYPGRCYYGFTIPLQLEGTFTELPKLVIYNQRYPSGGCKLVRDTDVSHIPQTHNQLVTDYQLVEGLTDEPFPEEYRQQYLTHLQPKWLHGLSVMTDFDWHIRSVMSFDSQRIHSASDYTRLGITRKLGLAIFTLSPN